LCFFSNGRFKEDVECSLKRGFCPNHTSLQELLIYTRNRWFLVQLVACESNFQQGKCTGDDLAVLCRADMIGVEVLFTAIEASITAIAIGMFKSRLRSCDHLHLKQTRNAYAVCAIYANVGKGNATYRDPLGYAAG
jgi:hypothetical protein